MKYQELETIFKAHHRENDLPVISKAYEFALHAHQGQKRKSGEDYIEHPIATAAILAKINMETNMIVAGLLHDVPEDTQYSVSDVQKEFGKDVAKLVEGITKLGQIKYRGMERYIENVQHMFLAMASDVRVIIIKCADRIHNLQTLDALPRAKQIRIALETIEIFSPIANRLGMDELKIQLEDLSFQYIEPNEYEWLSKRLSEKQPRKAKYLEKIIKKIKRTLAEEKIQYINIYGRNKNIYSIYKKLVKYHNDFDRIHDLVACRVIVSTVADCYAVLGNIHQLWKPIRGRIKDYIAQPKPNGYQSLHTTVFADDGERIEFQIRTEKMHQEAEYGIAAHWVYSEQVEESGYQKAFTHLSKDELIWMKEIIKWKKGVTANARYLEDLKIEVFQERIFVFTPKGDVIDLPTDATPVDFAYHIHTDLGNKCNGVIVNDQMTSLDTKLKSGDVVEIIIDKNRRGPNVDWLKFVKTRFARHCIKASLKKQQNGLLKRWLINE